MRYDFKDRDILALAHILKGNKVESDAVEKALRLICECTGSECGLVYDLDFKGSFLLKEHYRSKEFPLCGRIFYQETELKTDPSILNSRIFHINRSEANLQEENDLLDICRAGSMLIAPIADEKDNLHGLILLLNETSEEAPDEGAMNDLAAVLFMLAHFISMRIYEKKIVHAQASLTSILDNTGIDIYVNDFYSHEILYVNKSMAAPYGGQERLMGQKCWKSLFPGKTGPCEFCPEQKLLDGDGHPSKVYCWDYQRPFDGSWFRVFSAAFRWVDGRLAHVISSADITDNKRNEVLIEQLANYDQLTGLPNRRMLVAECKRRIDKASTTEKGYLLFFDIDGFKAINDNFGHDSGDEFLISLGEFFISIPLLKDSIYRNGGDEFVAVIGGEEIEKNNIASLANFIHERFRKPWQLKKGAVFCSTSIGVACYPEDGTTAEELLRKADMAMYYVKKNGGAGSCFGYQLPEMGNE